jgi:ferric-dicitrate binding protein FerR (iron transport regulator)
MKREDLGPVRAALEPPWDDLREQRVLRGAIESRKRGDRRRKAAAAGAAAFVALASVAVVAGFALKPEPLPAPQASVEAPTQASVLTLADGSRVTSQPDAQLQIELQQPTEVRLAQKSGQVLYEVTPDPARQFVVRVSNVQVRVKGTAFTVKVELDSVLVHVERGRVVVEDASGAAELGAGEELRRVLQVAQIAASVAAETTVSAPPKAPQDAPTIETMLERADRARASGRLDEAAGVLEEILAKHPRDKRVGTVRFTLGRVERQRGNHAKAAAAFRACSHGGLAEDALAEEASSWQAAGQPGSAREAAGRYLERFPSGPHAARMKRIVQ